MKPEKKSNPIVFDRMKSKPITQYKKTTFTVLRTLPEMQLIEHKYYKPINQL